MIILDALITQWKAVANVCNKRWINVCEHKVHATDYFIFSCTFYTHFHCFLLLLLLIITLWNKVWEEEPDLRVTLQLHYMYCSVKCAVCFQYLPHRLISWGKKAVTQWWRGHFLPDSLSRSSEDTSIVPLGSTAKMRWEKQQHVAAECRQEGGHRDEINY